MHKSFYSGIMWQGIVMTQMDIFGLEELNVCI